MWSVCRECDDVQDRGSYGGIDFVSRVLVVMYESWMTVIETVFFVYGFGSYRELICFQTGDTGGLG